MARKNLLTETEIRSFMKLAELGALGGDRIASLVGEEEELERELDATEDELGAEDQLADEEGDELDAMADMGDMGAEDEGGEMSLSDEEAQAIIDLAGRLEAAMGPAVDAGDEVEVEDEIEMGPEGGDEIEMDAIEDDELAGNRDSMYMEEDMVAEVARRVAARLQQDERKQEVIDTLAERIMKRLTK